MNHLSENEKTVLYNLVKHPLFNNREISEKTDLKLSTVTACRRRLKEKGYFFSRRVPIAHSIGCEIMCVAFSQFISSLSLDERLKLGSKFDIQHPDVFWMMSEPSQGMTIQFSKNYSDAKERIKKVEEIYAEHKYLGNHGITLLPFSFKLTNIINFFDYTFLLRRLFNIKDKKTISGFKGEKIKLSDAEKKAYYALIKYPELSDKRLAEKINFSRFTVSRMREKFEGKIMKTMNIPDMKKLGLKVVALIHMMFNLTTPSTTRKEIADNLLNQGAVFLSLEHVDILALIPFENFDCYRAYMNIFSKKYREYDILVEEPTILLFSVSESCFPKEHVYAPLVKKVLNI
ncbi:MAG: winged helix-turn-helix domain-containing protein [Candidatus Thermoplasmatota archaeon]|nr:winged helix-turn-helix domain-containing protein [Candidatus Thermoplasmatota archaeon]MBU4256345.1 winged helix-turn-helix domain-containing protein [Candidatus Thermoplasmatota archaeon]MCG2825283.1 winged helix-turn-helix domain-containing protein [Thermoplasmatales archaeon]